MPPRYLQRVQPFSSIRVTSILIMANCTVSGAVQFAVHLQLTGGEVPTVWVSRLQDGT